ncbi:MAG: anaerobic ribonucleoside-triphosphate reductase activating protein [Candidatus Omnitrophica bacterium]|nr:anaerobic ribonucleoside-triphosphate reductase activating protein [Candidatus Omnitrophota bacterium]
MKIGGLQKFSLIDYPAVISTVVFTQGCNYRCRYCHNPELVLPQLFAPPIPEQEIFAFLDRRKGMLEGAVITGGEPTLQPDLPDFLAAVKDKGYLVKLDTNGSRPALLRTVLKAGVVDYCALDLKAPAARYRLVCGDRADPGAVEESLRTVERSGIPYHTRTTWDERCLSSADRAAILSQVRAPERHIFQSCRIHPGILADYAGVESSAAEEIR